MKKNLNALIIFCLVAFFPLKSMSQNGAYSFEYTFGTSTPLGDFRDNNGQNDGAGFAKGGFSGELNLLYHLKSGNLAIIGSVVSQSNSFDADGYDRELSLETPGADWSIRSDAYSMASYLIGAQKEFEINEKFNFSGRAQLGISFGKEPEMVVREYSSGYWSVYTSNYAAGVALQLGGQLKYRVSNQLSYIVNARYIRSNFEFESTSNYNSFGEFRTYSYPKSFNGLNLSVGLSVNLTK